MRDIARAKRMKRYFNSKVLGVLIALAVGFSYWALSDASSVLNSSIVHLFSSASKEKLFAVTEHKPFVIVVPSFNNSEWVEKNLSSIFAQKYDNYRVIYIDDASTDDTFDKSQNYVAWSGMSHRIEVIHNEANKGGCENIFRALHSCSDEEIAIILDGDDWFAHDRVLQRLNEVYACPEVWMTYGSYIEYPSYGYTVANFAQPLPQKVIENNAVREYTRKHWCLSHLRTFYASLFKKVNLDDLQWDGNYYDAAYDLGFMIPMAEMAGSHAKYVKEILYIYNRATPLNDNKVRAKRQQQIAQHILDLPCYEPLRK